MLTRIRARLTYSNVMATAAVFLALGGGAIAASKLGRNTVGTKQLKKGAVHKRDLAKKAVTNAKLGDKAVSTGKIAGSAVTGSKIATGAVGTDELAGGAVTRAKVADSAIPFLGTLRSGQELRGSFNLGGTDEVNDGGAKASAGYSFQFPLNNPLSDSTVTVIGEFEAPTASCGGLSGGNQQTPLATPGSLCIYVTDAQNADPPAPIVPPGTFTRLGFGLEVSSDALGPFSVSGLWALTAP